MRLLFALCLFFVIGGVASPSWGEDAPAADATAPAAEPAPADETPAAVNPVAEKMALPTARHEKKYCSLRLDLVFFEPITDLPPVSVDDPDADGAIEGPVVVTKFDQDNNIRPVLQYHCPDTKTLFEINYLRMTQANEIGLGPKLTGQYWATLVTPNSGVDFSNSVAARASLNFIELNLLARHTIRRNDTMHYFVDWGFRWIQVRQHLKAHYVNANGGATTETVDIRSAVSAGGLAFGAGFEYDLYSWLKLNTRFGASMLQGSLSGSFTDTNSGGGVFASFTRNQTQLVPGLEAQAGLEFDPGIELPYAGAVVFHAGFEMKNYFQVTDISTVVDDIADGSLLGRRTNFGMSGYVVGVQFIWTVD